jgi:hypothetical protein
MKITHLLLFLLLMVFSFEVNAQKKKSRMQPGKMYEAGETLYAPRFGFTAKVPEGWEGILPRESEVFLLSSTTATYGDIWVFGNEHGDFTTMKKDWVNGLELTESIRIKAVEPIEQDGLLSSGVIAEGDLVNKGYKGFVVGRCSPSGPCVITLMIAPLQYYEEVKNTVTEFMKNSSFESPSNVSQYADFDWQDFLSNKVLVTFASVQGGSKETMIHLCKDGSFTATIKKKGFFKNQNPDYKGTLTGLWSAKGDGEKATLQFIFTNKSIAPVEVAFTIKDEKVVSDGERYFVGNSDKCK